MDDENKDYSDPLYGADEKALNRHGWEVECWSPFEVSKSNATDGQLGFASGRAAKIVLDYCRRNEPDDDE
jgi:hypothetical protein